MDRAVQGCWNSVLYWCSLMRLAATVRRCRPSLVFANCFPGQGANTDIHSSCVRQPPFPSGCHVILSARCLCYRHRNPQ